MTNLPNIIIQAVLLILVILSIISWQIIVTKFINFRKFRKNFEIFISSHLDLDALIKSLKEKNAFETADSSIQQICQEFLTNIEQNFKLSSSMQKEISEIQLNQQLEKISYHHEKGLIFLASIGSASPFIGLFGTVIGIYQALGSLKTGDLMAINTISGPIAEALIATAVGLVVAIPAVLAYNGFVRLKNHMMQNLQHFAEKLIIYQYSQK
jgi:biopolymer transport protein ExbB